MRTFAWMIVAFLLLVPVAHAADFDVDAWRAELETWHQEREERFRSPDGWLSIVGFYWLEPGSNPVGSGEDNTVILPVGPERAGTLVYTPGAGDPFTVQFRPATGLDARVQAGDQPEVALEGPVSMITSPPGPTTRIHVDRVAFWVLNRAMGKAAVRIQDPESDLIATFPGIDAYPLDPAWRILGRYEPFPEPRTMLIPNQLGHTDTTEAYGRVVFTVDGVEHDLIPTQDGADDPDLFFVFADETTGVETYGAGRFLYTPIQENGVVVMDFNRAYNPPCAYNPWTTCPLPPEGNTLPFKVEAGELKAAE